MADGTITFSTELDNTQLETDLKKAEKDVETLKRKVEKSESDRNAVADKLTQAREEAAKTEAGIVKLVERLKELEELAETDPVGAAGRAEAVTEELVEQFKLYDDQQTKIEALEGKWDAIDAQTRKYTADLEAARQRQAELGAEYAKTMRGKGLTDGIKAVESRMDAFASKVTKTMKKVFVFGVIAKGLKELKAYLSEALAENERFQASWSNLKATIQGVANYVAQGLAPVLTGFVNIVAAMIATLAGMVDSIFKTNIADAIAHAKQAAQATDKQAKSTKKLGKEAKEANRQLMSFDEINAMNASTSQDAADALDAEVEAPGLNWDAFDVGKIDEKLAEIMAIVGAALIALGAILCFSGINIPLGITLMAIGALMVYTAYREQWDKLPADVQSAINMALVITSFVLLVLGAILAFSGINIPLGIGLMLAGATMLGIVAALNWEALSGELQGAISKALEVIGIVALVLGAVLAFSGANVPLGIGMMLFGAAALALDVALNWEELSGHLNETISGALELFGAIALAVGAVLAFSGIGIPVGVGLMLAGAAALAGAVILNWDDLPGFVNQLLDNMLELIGGIALAVGAVLAFSGVATPIGIGLMVAGASVLAGSVIARWETMPDQIKEVINHVLVIGGALALILGIILCMTGVGIPIGIGLIIAGAGLLAGAVAINWDFLKDKVREIWQGIVNFWNSNIAPIFTWEWWKNLFKSIINGLIYCINSGLNAFGGFVNMLGQGIGGLLSMFGIGGFSFSVSMPQIPYLAQGAVIPPNREFLAVLGDQKRGTNLEAPEDLIRQIVREESGGLDAAAMQQAITASLLQVLPLLQQQGGSDGDAIMVLRVGNEELARAVNKGNASMMRRGLIDPGMEFA